MRSPIVFSAILGLGSLLAYPAGAQPNGYTLSIVAKTGDTIGGKTLTTLCCPSINNAGKVAFRASSPPAAPAPLPHPAQLPLPVMLSPE